MAIVSFGTADGLARVPRQAICYANADLVSDAFRAVNGCDIHEMRSWLNENRDRGEKFTPKVSPGEYFAPKFLFT